MENHWPESISRHVHVRSGSGGTPWSPHLMPPLTGAQRGKLEITPRPVAGGQQAPGAGAGNQKANAAKLVIIYSIYA